MKKTVAILCLVLGGCSTAPVADVLDWIHPGQLRADPKTVATGGVCQPPLPIAAGPAAPLIPAPPGGPVIPPPVPFPGTGGVPAVPSMPVPPPPPPGANF